MTYSTSIMTVPLDPASATGTQYVFTKDGGENVLVSGEGAVALAPSGSNTGSQIQLRETDGGAVFMYLHSRGMYLGKNPNGWLVAGDLSDAIALIPQLVNGQLQFRYIGDGATGWVGATTVTVPPIVVVDASLSGYWEPHPTGAPTGTAGWRHTYDATNHFSPYVFLKHLRKVIEHQDLEHAGEDYWQGLTDLNAAGVSYAVSILAKADWWLEEDFDVATQGQQASSAMGAAASNFYTAQTGEVKELDPKRPPDWPGIDDELGNNPYPG